MGKPVSIKVRKDIPIPKALHPIMHKDRVISRNVHHPKRGAVGKTSGYLIAYKQPLISEREMLNAVILATSVISGPGPQCCSTSCR